MGTNELASYVGVHQRTLRALAKRQHTLPTEEQWLLQRQLGIGASEALGVLGLGAYATPLTVYLDKRGLGKERAPSHYMEAGKRLEPLIADWYADRTGDVVLDPGAFTLTPHRSASCMQATLDRVALRKGLPGPGVVEIKNTNDRNADDWDPSDPPLSVQVQVQHQLACSGLKWGLAVVLIGGHELRVCEPVMRDEDFIGRMERVEEKFWARVVAGDMPEPGEGVADAAALAGLYPNSNGLAVLLPGVLEMADDRLMKAKALRKRLDGVIRECENSIKASMEDNEIGLLPSGSSYTFKTVERKGYEVKATTYRTLRRKARR